MTNFMHVDDWQVWQHASRLSELTITERVRVITQLGIETGTDPAKVTPIQIVRWLASHSEWSDSTMCTYHSYLRRWFKWLQAQGLREDDPMVKVGTPRLPEREPRPVSDIHLAKLITTRMHKRTRFAILIACLAGLRVSEIARIKGEDVDLSGPRMRVLGKRGKQQSVAMHPLLVDIAHQMPSRGWWFPANSVRPGEHMLGKSMSQMIGRVMQRAGVPGTPHSLRHWFGTTLLLEGADIRTVQELMRHSSIASTQLYTMVPDKPRHEAIGRLDPFRYKGSGPIGSAA
ncbi:tyrosine-type recombinase/integrase [Hoyosella altamirensis]|uniref:Site-specific recombinase XerD n=1 Tax=Hoyosella altamirensis TaxID=616997 RepID=A0A839RKW8_9ACTN|nr:tyrosine-type recombinase/integrase [Hoyosella altamirensis]MBB3037335.1 site-specific recombinase XerD [Hoyosella altamirensis]